MHAFMLVVAALCAEAAILPLGDDRFETREGAQLYVESQEWLYPYLLQQAQACADPEIRQRCRRACAVHDQRLLPAGWVCLPWIDSLPFDFPGREALIERTLRAARGAQVDYYGPDYPDYRQATALWVRELLASGTPRSTIHRHLERMAERERALRQQMGVAPIP